MELTKMSIEELRALRAEIDSELKTRTVETKKVIVNLDFEVDSRHKNWAKLITKVDTAQSNGYAFEGEFVKLNVKHELKVGSVILIYKGEGSMKNYDVVVETYEVTANGLQNINIGTRLDNRKANGWALEIRDRLADFMNKN